MPKIVALNGSPRRQGSTAALVEEIVKGAVLQGAEADIYDLNGMNIRGCQSCYTCKSEGRCAVQDDMQELYGQIAAADGLILGTPVYMWQMSAQLKLAVDRLLPFLKPGYVSALAPGKKVVLAVTQGREDTAMFRPYFEQVAKNLLFLGFGACEILIAGGTRQPADLLKQAEVLAEARRLGEWLAESGPEDAADSPE
jgi:multimeric flavodoxin WrbA